MSRFESARERVIGLALALLACLPATAQSLRDPTQAPAGWQQAGAGLASGGVGGAQPPGEQAPGRMSILVIDGRPHVIQGTRLFAVGQMLGQARIERITESAVWLREGGELRKIDNFAGIQRGNPDEPQPACGPGAKATGSAARGARPGAVANTCDSRKP